MFDNRESPRVSPLVQLALCTFGILVLELAIIRWMSSQIRIVAYFSNVVLLASFLGMGLGSHWDGDARALCSIAFRPWLFFLQCWPSQGRWV